MPSAFMPDVEVHIAFNSGYTTPAASRVWVDVSSYVELADRIAIDVGRQDERSSADANSLTLTLDNTDGRFTAARTGSPYYPYVKIGRPIRVRVTPPGGSAVTRFLGYVDEWPLEWAGSDAYATAKIRASSRLARLGLTAKLRSVIEQEILTDSPAAYYMLGDPSGSLIAVDSSGSQRDPATVAGTGAAVVFGNATGPAFDGLTAAEFAGSTTYNAAGSGTVTSAGQYLTATVPAAEVRAIRAAVRVTALPPTSAHCYVIEGGSFADVEPSGNGNLNTPAIAIDDAGRVCIRGLVGPSINDGATHDVMVRITPGTETRLYVDGVSAGVGTTLGSLSPTNYRIGRGLTGAVSHAAVYTVTTPSATRVAAQALVVRTGAAGERTDQRVLRILGWAGVPAAEVTVETGLDTMDYQQTSGQSIVDALRECESTEGGVLFDGPDGNVRFHNRTHRYLAAAVASLNMLSHHIGADYAPKMDRSALVNDVEVSNPTTGEKARKVDTTSSGEYGVATAAATSVADTYDPLVQKAAWLIATYAEPRIRVPSLTVDVVAHQGLTPSAQTLIGVTVGDLLAVTNSPTQAATSAPSYFVEGYTETIGPESYDITFNLSPTYLTLDTLVLDGPSRGRLDTGVLAL